MQIRYEYDTTWGRNLNINLLKWIIENPEKLSNSLLLKNGKVPEDLFIGSVINQDTKSIFIVFSLWFPYPILFLCIFFVNVSFFLGIENLEMPGNSLDFLQILLSYEGSTNNLKSKTSQCLNFYLRCSCVTFS